MDFFHLFLKHNKSIICLDRTAAVHCTAEYSVVGVLAALSTAPLAWFPVLLQQLVAKQGKALPRALAEMAVCRLAHILLHKHF